VKLADFIGTELRDAIAKALADDKELLTGIAEAGGKAVQTNRFDDVGTLADVLSALLGPVGVALGIIDPPIAVMTAVEKAAGKEGSSFAFGYAAGYAIWQLMQPAVLPLEHAVAAAFTNEVWDVPTIVDLVTRGLVHETDGATEAAASGMDAGHLGLMVQAALKRPGMAEMLELLNRGELPEPDLLLALEREGYNDFWRPLIVKLRRNLLSPADLALNNLRGEMTDADATAYAESLGMTPGDFQRLVENTGEPPGPEQLMEALRRGFIDQPRFEHGIRQSRIRNEWIDVETKLRLAPMSTADAVRAVIEHYLTDEQGKEIAAQNGLIPEHWAPLRDSWGRPLSHEQMMSLYHRGEVTLDDVHQAFRESDMKDKYFEQSVKLGETLVPQRQITQMLQHGVIKDADAMSMLLKLGYDKASARALIDLGSAEHKTSLHALTKSDIVTAYADFLMPRDEAIKHLVSLSFTKQDAVELLDLSDVKAHRATLKATQNGVKASLQAKHLTQAEAISQLIDAGMTHAQALQLTDLWIVQHGNPTRSLTEAQVLKLAEVNLITWEDCRDRLIGLGLVAADADLLLKLHGIGPAPPPAPPVIGPPPVGTPGG
jgi:hypothetical protein